MTETTTPTPTAAETTFSYVCRGPHQWTKRDTSWAAIEATVRQARFAAGLYESFKVDDQKFEIDMLGGITGVVEKVESFRVSEEDSKAGKALLEQMTEFIAESATRFSGDEASDLFFEVYAP